MFLKVQNKLKRIIDKIYTYIICKSFMNFGKNSVICFPCKIDNPSNILIGDNVTICKNVWLNAGVKKRDDNQPSLNIKDGSYISSYTHINAFSDVTIERNVLIGEGVYFGDTIHSTDNYNLPIIKQEYIFQGKIIIGEGSHLCRNSTISSECIVGKNVIICPGSFVVQKEIPSYSMAIGNPASLIEDYNKKNDKS